MIEIFGYSPINNRTKGCSFGTVNISNGDVYLV